MGWFNYLRETNFCMPLFSIRNILIQFLFLASIAGCGSSKKMAIRERKVDTVIKTARSYTGVPYKWGGTSRSGMDCSGLLLKSFEAINMEIPRTSIAQSKMGKNVNLQDVKEGDLVFFAAGKKKRRITHVGLVTNVRSKDDVRFIHASSSKGVIEVNLMSRYYQKILVKAIRPPI